MITAEPKCNLILDSCCDLPVHILDDAGIEYFKFPFIMNDGEHLDDFWGTMDSKGFYNRLRKGEVSGTAQIPMPTLHETFERAAKKGMPTVYLAFTSGLSGTFETAQNIAEEIRKDYPDFELYVVDTKLASIAEGLLVYEAIHLRDRGFTAKQIASWAEEALWHVQSHFTLDELEHLRRGGRIPDMAATAGSKLNIKPMLTFGMNGELALAGVARGRKKSLKALVNYYNERHATGGGSDQTVIVAHADAEGDAKWVAERLDRPDTSLPVIMSNIGPVIGSHVGPGMVAIVFWGDDRREKISIADKIANKFKADNA